jgi:hypothetical protein
MGGKNQDAANSSWTEVSSGGSSLAPQTTNKIQKCKKGPKHWIGVRVEDEDGNLVKDVVIHAKLEDAEYSMDLATAALDSSGVSKTKKIFDSTECEFSFPDLYDVDWWIKGGSKPASFPGEQAIAMAPGDCIVSAAEAAGFRDYHEIWDCPANADARKASPNANQQSLGSSWQAPNKKTTKEKPPPGNLWVTAGLSAAVE